MPRFYGTRRQSATTCGIRIVEANATASKGELMGTSGEDFEADVDQLFDVENEDEDEEDEEGEDEKDEECSGQE